MQLCFEKLLKFEICLKIKNIIKTYSKIIKTIPKNLTKFVKVCKSL